MNSDNGCDKCGTELDASHVRAFNMIVRIGCFTAQKVCEKCKPSVEQEAKEADSKLRRIKKNRPVGVQSWERPSEKRKKMRCKRPRTKRKQTG